MPALALFKRPSVRSNSNCDLFQGLAVYPQLSGLKPPTRLEAFVFPNYILEAVPHEPGRTR
jgi:hypothetical protein